MAADRRGRAIGNADNYQGRAQGAGSPHGRRPRSGPPGAVLSHAAQALRSRVALAPAPLRARLPPAAPARNQAPLQPMTASGQLPDAARHSSKKLKSEPARSPFMKSPMIGVLTSRAGC